MAKSDSIKLDSKIYVKYVLAKCIELLGLKITFNA